MFWKVFGGIVLFFMAVVLAVTMLATAGAAALGVGIASVVENFDLSTVQVTDASGNTETYNVNDLIAESGRVEVTGDNGERVTIDLEIPQITVQESGEDAARVVIGESRFEINPGVPPRFEINPGVPQIRIDGRDFDNFDGSFIVRPVVSVITGLFKLAAWVLIIAGIWLLLRNRQPAATEPKEKTPNATA